MSYPAYQQAANQYQSSHYPNHYLHPPAQNITAPPQSYFPLQPSAFQVPSRQSPSPERPPSPPDLASISPSVASKSINRLLSFQLQNAGFDGAEPLALQRLEREVVAFVERLYERSQQHANLANRAGPIATDLLRACEELGVVPKELHRIGSGKASKRKRIAPRGVAATLVPPESRSPSPELLASDDEDVPPIIPTTLRHLPSYLPGLPPKHTYLRTPASPPKKAALPSLEKKLKTAGLVQESLRNLLLATEDSSGQEDGELLGHIVNWEMGMHPRKRWKLNS